MAPGSLPLPPHVPALSTSGTGLCDLDTDALNRGNAAIAEGKSGKLQHCVLEVGELVYVPQQWYHATCYMEPHTITAGYSERALLYSVQD